jgi:hypothetical protein
MITDKEIVSYLKKNKLRGKAYVLNWYLNGLYIRLGKPEWLVDGTFLGYIKKNYRRFTDPDPIRVFIDDNYPTAKKLFDDLKKKIIQI